MVTFRLSDFERSLLDIKLSKDYQSVIRETTDKFHLGVAYAMTFDPGLEFSDMIKSQKFFFVDDANNIIKANDTNLFVNAIDYSDDVRCEIVYKIVYKTNCTIVIFRFMPAHPFNISYPYTSIYRTEFRKNCFLRGKPEDGRALSELCENDPNVVKGASIKWIITNDIYAIKGIHSDIVDDDTDEDTDTDYDDDADEDLDDEDILDDDDSENSDESDGDSDE